MRKKLKRLLAMAMVVSMTMSLLSGMASAAEKTSDIQIVEQGGKIYYLADPQEGDVAGEDNFDVWTSKTITGTPNEDEFEVTLQVGTTMKAIPNDVAVVLVMDASSSMMTDKDGKQWGEYGVLPTDGRNCALIMPGRLRWSLPISWWRIPAALSVCCLWWSLAETPRRFYPGRMPITRVP